MKQKLLYLASVAVVVSSSVLALLQVEGGSLLPNTNRAQVSNEMSHENESISNVIERLQSKYPHIKRPCLYATAMIMDDQSGKIPTLLETETKCIHTLVIAEGQEAHLAEKNR